MAYKGISPQLGSYIKLDNISHLFDGVTKTFPLTSGGNPFHTTNPYTLFLVLGGVVQEPIVSFTVDRDQITFATAPTIASQYYCLKLGDTFHSGGLKSIPIFTRDGTRNIIPITATTVPVITRTETVGVLINPA
jgi:hypothetical protein